MLETTGGEKRQVAQVERLRVYSFLNLRCFIRAGRQKRRFS